MTRSLEEVSIPADRRDLPKRTRVLVIGGGVVGCSVLYHLAAMGESDAVLVERKELTSGSSWHAAGMLSQYHHDRVHLEIIKAGRALYGEFEKDPETSVGLHSSGDLVIARNDIEMLDLKRWSGVAKSLDLPAEIVGPEQIKTLFPLMETAGILGGMWFPTSGFVDPSLATHSFARQARSKGAKIFQQCGVEAIVRQEDETWLVSTNRGKIQADYIVNCAGVWAPEISAMIGEVIPAIGIEHQMMVFNAIPEVKALDFELPMLHDPSTPIYTRADRDGLILSSYPDATIFFGVDGIPSDFSGELLPPETDRGEGKIIAAMELIPALQSVGVRAFVNGAIPRSADRVPLVGPAHGYKNYFLSCSNYGGFLFAALGRYLAEWLLEGEPSINLSQMDPRRFGEYADKFYAIQKMQGVATGHTGSYAGLEMDSGKPLGAGAVWTSPVYGLMKSRRAVLETVDGWEVPKWFARPGDDTRELPSFMTANWMGAVGDEREALLNAVGIIDLTSHGKFEIIGPDAGAYLSQRLAVNAPQLNEVVDAPALNRLGGLVGLWQASQPQPGVYYLTGSAKHARRDLDSLRWEMFGDVTISDLTRDRAVLALAGPRAADVLDRIGWRGPGDRSGLPSGAEDGRIGYVPARLIRSAYGKVVIWELHTRMEYQAGLYERLLAAGGDYGIKDVGLLALSAIRMEAGIPMLGIDINHGADPRDMGREGWLDINKADFVGKSALLARQRGKGSRLFRFEIDTTVAIPPADPSGDEPVMFGEKCVGYVTSATPSYMGKISGFALLDPQSDWSTSNASIQILGESVKINIMPL
ncbi:FAD-dependent oxidoreductase [Agrobacterium sp. LAD9]|uniref:FAD-dependent oxidoreductase n=1 Tax=Agrobacterium sp. LAD9 TaxID=2055153 RepID=UPI000D1E8716|nr:FAD-dependent oxidoreductase [Agrobacterium sp. LAD9]